MRNKEIKLQRFNRTNLINVQTIHLLQRKTLFQFATFKLVRRL